MNFNYKSLPGKYSMEFAYFEKIDESKNLTFEVEQTDISLPPKSENLNILSINNNAEQFFEMGLYSDAIKNYKMVIENSNSIIEPLYLNALNKIGLALIELRNYEKSLSYFEQVYEINPDFPDIKENLENSKFLISSNGIPIEEKSKLSVPGWIKSTAGWWIAGQTTDDTFIEGLQYMQNKGMIGNYEFSNYSKSFIPNWIKELVSWWVDGKIGDDEFLKTIDYLSEKGIIII